MTLLTIALTACLATPEAHALDDKAVAALAATYIAVLDNREQEHARLLAAYNKVKDIKPPRVEPVGKRQKAEQLKRHSALLNLRASLREQLDECEDVLATLKKTSLPPMPAVALSPDTKVGTIGTLQSVSIVQVLTDRTALVAHSNEGAAARLHLDTDGVVDGAAVDGTAGLFIVSGTYSYDTAFGKRTVLDIKPLDTAPIQKEIERRLKQ